MAAQAQPTHLGWWWRRWLAAGIVVVLVLALLAGVLVLQARFGGALSASVEAGGLQMSIAVPPGPYFLSELLEVRLTLANHSQTTYQVRGRPESSACDTAIWVGQSGGGPPTYQFPIVLIGHCAPGVSTLAPGAQWSFALFLPLTSCGSVTLSAQAAFLTIISTEPDGSTTSAAGVGPFTRGWPSVAIQVVPLPRVPINRTITLAVANDRVSISAPPGAQLYYLYGVACWEGGGTGYASTNGYWQPISSTTLAEPSCPGGPERWQYWVAAPGYAIASGMLGSL
jgi:hypothetical protein